MPSDQLSIRRHRSFNRWFDLLCHFHNQFGHCNVKRKQSGYEKLAGWVHRMRQKRKKGSLHHDEVEALDSVGFQWTHISSPLSLDDAIAFLRQFKEKHGHCNVPYTYSHNQRIATWAHNQRSQLARKFRHQSSTMSTERFDRLVQVGLFDFSTRDALISLVNIPATDPYKPPLLSHSAKFGKNRCTAIPNLSTVPCTVCYPLPTRFSSRLSQFF